VKYLVTGGAGFIGRWCVDLLLKEADAHVVVLDNYSNGRRTNLAEFTGDSRLSVVEGDIGDGPLLDRIWQAHGPFDAVYHLAAKINVQESIDDPVPTFQSDVSGTVEVLERCRKQFMELNGLSFGGKFHLLDVESQLKDLRPRVVLMSTCMVYSPALDRGIDEKHPTRPASPYGACKIAAENIVLSYYHAYKLPTKVIRPFNTYGPFQKRNTEGGVVAIFIARDLAGQPLLVKGSGEQTRDLLYIEDCARFVVAAGKTAAGDGEIVNAGLGRDVSVNELARLVASPSTGGKGVPVQHIVHDHPQAEIMKLLCDNRRAMDVYGWRPAVDLEEGIRRTRIWIAANPDSL
jgi:UDP-glucose 4-epimerase